MGGPALEGGWNQLPALRPEPTPCPGQPSLGPLELASEILMAQI